MYRGKERNPRYFKCVGVFHHLHCPEMTQAINWDVKQQIKQKLLIKVIYKTHFSEAGKQAQEIRRVETW